MSTPLSHYILFFFFLKIRPPPKSTLLPHPTLFPSSPPRTAVRRTQRGRSESAGRSAPTMSIVTAPPRSASVTERSEEHTSELQSRQYLVCRLLLEKKKKHNDYNDLT